MEAAMVAENALPDRIYASHLFADSLLETPRGQRARRNWTTLTSFGLETLAIAVALLLPLWTTVGLPKAHSVSTPVSLGRPHIADPGPVPTGAHVPQAFRDDARLRFMTPQHIPAHVFSTDEPSTAPPCNACIDIGQTTTGDPNGPAFAIGGDHSIPLPPPPPKPAVREFRPSNMLEGSLIRRVQPIYPYTAKVAHVQGAVVLAAVIGKTGAIENLRVLSGHPLLAGSAVDAVKQWRYRPYVLNGDPIEVDTQITVNFILGEN
jgi:periplasmic protein TonB